MFYFLYFFHERPFGVALLIGGCDEHGPSLYHTDPSGTFIKYDAKATGSGSEGAQKTLEDDYSPDFTLEEAERLAMNTLKEAMEEKVSLKNVEVATITPKDGYKLHSKEQLQAAIERLGA